MQNLLCVSVLIVVLGLSLAKRHILEPLSDEEIDYINSVQSSWTAGRNFHPSQFKSMMGANMKTNAESIKRLPVNNLSFSKEDLPESFDAREQWPHCDTIKEIRDQGECRSNYAMVPVETISDRICVATGKNVRISTEDVLACCYFCGYGCGDGDYVSTYEYYQVDGIVTGGAYNSSQGCMPYGAEPCDHYGPGKLKNCSTVLKPTPICTKQCIPSYNSTYAKDKYFAESCYEITGVSNIMGEIYTNGSVTALFEIYSDFLSYKSGVYKHTTGVSVRSHAVRLIGWGVENDTDYWLATNSWNTDWGDKGLFKIAKGVDECLIEDRVMTAIPKV